MNVIDVGRYTMAVTSSGILALTLSDCAIRSSSPMPPSAATTAYAPTGSQTFNYTGKKQTFLVPASVTRLTITAYGGSGGTLGSYTGGHGGLVKAEISVMPRESLSVFVGESGRIGARRAFNGGGAGYGKGRHRSGGGGGASDVRLDTGIRILVAGGGGSSFIEKSATIIKNVKGGAPSGDGSVVIPW